MGKKKPQYEKFSIERQILANFNEIIYQFPFMKGLVEVDITDARRKIKEYRAES